MTVRLTPHFTLSEFDPHDGGTVPTTYTEPLRRLCTRLLEPMRVVYGPCTIVSGYRSVRHNQAVGGAKNSHHVYPWHPGSPAADVKFARGTPAQWYAYADTLLGKTGGLGRYATHLHVDLRPTGTRW